MNSESLDMTPTTPGYPRAQLPPFPYHILFRQLLCHLQDSGRVPPPISGRATRGTNTTIGKSRMRPMDDWKRSTLATVTAHGCELIMDPVYKPTNQDELELFVEMQKFMYDVFIGTLKNSMGQHFVRAHEATGDAQAVWRDYSSYMRTSTKADMELEDLLSLIRSTRITTSYRGPTIKFITDLLDYIRRYEALVPTKSRFPSNMKKAMLQNALQGHDAFHNATQIERYSIAQGNGPLDFDAYVELVQKVAAQ